MTDVESTRDTLIKIKEIGYECVQLASSCEKMRYTAEICNQIGLSVVGLLVDMDTCEKECDKLFEIAEICGAKDIGISSSIKTEDEAYTLIRRVNAFAKKARDNGFTFSYHNHSNEFIRGESKKTLIELLIAGFDPSLVDFMPDTYWIQHGGADVRAFVEGLGGRIKILHLKDMKRSIDGPTFSEVGAGNINFEGIIDVANKIGVKHFIVEQDIWPGDPFESLKYSRDYLDKFIK
jgi:sugar phosphate isomerase/epimerase